MRQGVPIPERCKKLKVDHRGYPIPYFVSYVDGKPDFRLLDSEKQEICVKYHKCAICGEKLTEGAYFFIGGIMTATNEVSTDPPMHRECAEWSLQICPHLYYEKADRN